MIDMAPINRAHPSSFSRVSYCDRTDGVTTVCVFCRLWDNGSVECWGWALWTVVYFGPEPLNF